MKNPIAKAFKGKVKREKGKGKNPIATAAQVIKHMDFSLFPFHFSLKICSFYSQKCINMQNAKCKTFLAFPNHDAKKRGRFLTLILNRC